MAAIPHLYCSVPSGAAKEQPSQRWRTSATASMAFLSACALSPVFYLGRGFNRSSHSANAATADDVSRSMSVDNSRRIAWLMSFPNSGTSYTNLLVRVVSGHPTATNYGSDYGTGTGIPVFADLRDGPYYSGDLERAEEEYSRPDGGGYLLTKTHCGSYCQWCSSEEYVSSPARFAESCAASTRLEDALGNVAYVDTNATSLVRGQYHNGIVGRAVHIVRDPFDNIVARFHHDRTKLSRENKPQKYALSRDGFRAMCQEMDAQYDDDVRQSPFYREVRNVVQKIPCRGDFFRYVQWHNNACITGWNFGLPTMVLHYESYEDDFEGTVGALHDFLGLERRNEAPLFVSGKTYRHYFEDEEVAAVKAMFKKLALAKTWEQLERYFDE